MSQKQGIWFSVKMTGQCFWDHPPLRLKLPVIKPKKNTVFLQEFRRNRNNKKELIRPHLNLDNCLKLGL